MRRFQARCGSSGGENCSASRTASALRPQFACAPLRAACALIPVFLESAASGERAAELRAAVFRTRWGPHYLSLTCAAQRAQKAIRVGAETD